MNQISFDFTGNVKIKSVADLMRFLEGTPNKPIEKRDFISALNRTCEMSNKDPAFVEASPPVLRAMLEAIVPAAHGIKAKSLTNMRSLVGKALALAGLVDHVRGRASKCPLWGDLAKTAQQDRKIESGLATFMGYCSLMNISPSAVSDETVHSFLIWVTNRTVLHDPQDLTRQVPTFWEHLRAAHPEFGLAVLKKVSFAKPRKMSWNNMPASFRGDAEAYLSMLADPDLDDEDAPSRPLAPLTLRQIREQLRLAYAAVIDNDGETPLTLADLVTPEALKLIIGAYRKSDGRSSAFLNGMIQCLMQVAELHVKLAPETIATLKKKTKRFRHSPVGLTEKNKALLRHFDHDVCRDQLLRLPDRLMREGRELMEHDLAKAARLFQAGMAIGLLINAPMRSQNLIDLSFESHLQMSRHKGPARILIPVVETKSKRMDLFYELTPQLSQAIRWYQTTMLPALQANRHGRLFVQPGGRPRSQQSLAKMIKDAVLDHIGIHMTPHQFRHFAAKFYLDAQPEDFETVRGLLGHSFMKTTLTYAGLGTERASKVYGQFVTEQSVKLRRRPTKTKAAPKKPNEPGEK